MLSLQTLFTRGRSAMLLLPLSISALSAQQIDNASTAALAPASDTTVLEKRIYVAQRTTSAPNIDGLLEPEVYAPLGSTTGFTTWRPEFGKADPWDTRVYITYDDRAIYVAAELLYPSPDSISREVRPRDDIGNADFFGVVIDPYRSGVNGFGFYTTAVGGQFDAIYANDNEDSNWDAVWRNAVVRHDSGWTVEVEIPYSAIRFPNAPIQEWGLQLIRRTAINQVRSAWSPFDPNKPGFLPQIGVLHGVRDISPPPRIQASPFVVASGSDYADRDGAQRHTWGKQFGGGVDLKVGLSDAFTLDMTLIPDFSEARQDNQVLNLSPFEVRFDENRPFFTEGVELFNKGNFFYSRRVGGTPLNFSEAYRQAAQTESVVLNNPQSARLLNATKISGRTEGGLGIGVFNAISAEAQATLRSSDGTKRDFTTQPLTNYNVAVLDQNLPNNSFVTLINTSVLRAGSVRDANLTGLVYQLRNKAKTYQLAGQGAVSQRYRAEGSAQLGHQIDANLSDNNGSATWNLGYSEWSPTYDQSDLGFQRRNNYRQATLNLGFNRNTAFGPFSNGGFGLSSGYERYIDPEMFSRVYLEVYAFGQSKGNWSFNPFLFVEPAGTRDIFEARTLGRYVFTPKSAAIGGSIGSDRRKAVYFEIYGGPDITWDDPYKRRGFDFGFDPSWRVNTQLTLELQSFYADNINEIGFAERLPNGEPVLGRRRREVVTNGAVVRYTVTPRLGFDLRGRHYWSRVEYQEFFGLDADGGFRQNPNYRGQRDETFNALTWDLVARWRFAPGSDLLFVYKNALFTGEDAAEQGYFPTWQGLLREPQTHTFTLKLNYWLDYDELRHVRRRSS